MTFPLVTLGFEYRTRSESFPREPPPAVINHAKNDPLTSDASLPIAFPADSRRQHSLGRGGNSLHSGLPALERIDPTFSGIASPVCTSPGISGKGSSRAAHWNRGFTWPGLAGRLCQCRWS